MLVFLQPRLVRLLTLNTFCESTEQDDSVELRFFFRFVVVFFLSLLYWIKPRMSVLLHAFGLVLLQGLGENLPLASDSKSVG